MWRLSYRAILSPYCPLGFVCDIKISNCVFNIRIYNLIKYLIVRVLLSHTGSIEAIFCLCILIGHICLFGRTLECTVITCAIIANRCSNLNLFGSYNGRFLRMLKTLNHSWLCDFLKSSAGQWEDRLGVQLNRNPLKKCKSALT